MNEMPVDIKQARAVGLAFDNVVIPNFIVECSFHGLSARGQLSICERFRKRTAGKLGAIRAKAMPKRGQAAVKLSSTSKLGQCTPKRWRFRP